jgi:hypothetical protein
MMFSSFTCRFALLVAATCATVTSASEPPVQPLEAADFTILAKTGITNVQPSIIMGDICVSPIAATAMTGFDFSLDLSVQFATSQQVVAKGAHLGHAYAASFGAPISEHLTTAVGAMEAAYIDAAGRPNPDMARVNLGGGMLGGVYGGTGLDSLTPGVYTFSTGVIIENDITFDGSAEDVFIIQVAGSLKQAADTRVHLTGGALAANIFWQVGGFVEVRSDAHMEGIMLVKTKADFLSRSSLNGRILTQTACNLQQATIIEPEDPPTSSGRRGLRSS